MKIKKILFIFILLVSIFELNLTVNAETCSISTSETCSSLLSNYNAGKTKNISVTSGSTVTDNVTVYGKSVCTESSCIVDWSGYNSYEELLKNKVVCSGGEKYINIQSGTSDATDYKTSTANSKNKTNYFSEKYSVTCTGEATSGAVELSNESNTTITNSSSTSTNTTVTNSGSGVENPGTGVETYYIILGVTAIGAYLITIKVKKHNLFKNI